MAHDARKNREELASYTHARLRAAQGDLSGARTMLRRVLRHDPHHAAARELLRRIDVATDSPHDEPGDEDLRAPEAGDPRQLAEVFRRGLSGPAAPCARVRIARLESWLERVRAGASGRS